MVSKEQLLEKEVEVLRNEVLLLQDRIDRMLLLFAPTLNIPEEWDLPNRAKQVIRVLYSANRPILGQHLHILCFNEVSNNANDFINYQVWESHISKLRQQLRKLCIPIEIRSKRFEGYWLTPDSKVYLKQFAVSSEVENV